MLNAKDSHDLSELGYPHERVIKLEKHIEVHVYFGDPLYLPGTKQSRVFPLYTQSGQAVPRPQHRIFIFSKYA